MSGELIEGRDIRLLWHCSFYDGPINGIAEHDGRKVWFTCPDWDDIGWRRYRVYTLTDEQIATEVAAHADFDQHVGTHTNYAYDESGRRLRRVHEGLQPNWRDWYEQPHEPIDRTQYEANPIGWFSKSPHNRRARSRRYFERRLDVLAPYDVKFVPR